VATASPARPDVAHRPSVPHLRRASASTVTGHPVVETVLGHYQDRLGADLDTYRNPVYRGLTYHPASGRRTPSTTSPPRSTRQADRTDVLRGALRGFHRFLIHQTCRNLIRHPLPMYRW
jgi:hypothetical protein